MLRTSVRDDGAILVPVMIGAGGCATVRLSDVCGPVPRVGQAVRVLDAGDGRVSARVSDRVGGAITVELDGCGR